MDDILIAGNDISRMDEIMTSIGRDFELKDLEKVSHYLGNDVERNQDGSFSICMPRYIDKIVA